MEILPKQLGCSSLVSDIYLRGKKDVCVCGSMLIPSYSVPSLRENTNGISVLSGGHQY